MTFQNVNTLMDEWNHFFTPWNSTPQKYSKERSPGFSKNTISGEQCWCFVSRQKMVTSLCKWRLSAYKDPSLSYTTENLHQPAWLLVTWTNTTKTIRRISTPPLPSSTPFSTSPVCRQHHILLGHGRHGPCNCCREGIHRAGIGQSHLESFVTAVTSVSLLDCPPFPVT